MIEFKKHLLKGLKKFQIEISDNQADLMALHAKELMLWNKKINLTAIKEPLQIAEKHFVDSIVASSFIEKDQSMIDMGAGGGFPGIPIKIINPDLKLILIDSSRKKINFLKHVIRLLKLKEIDAVHYRVQDLHEDALYKNKFDGVISRAFTDLSKFADLAKPFLNKTGKIYAMKGKQAKKEITPNLSKDFNIKIDHYTLPFENSERYVIKLS